MTDRVLRTTTEEFITANRLTMIRVVFADLHGTLRGKVFPAPEYIRKLQDGFRFSQAVFARDMLGRRVDATQLTLDTGAQDYIARPDLDTYCVMPWQPGMGQVLADLFTMNGDLVPFAPRAVLRRVVQLAETSQVLPSVGSELEFYLLDQNLQEPAVPDAQPYSASDVTQPGLFLDEALSFLQRMHLQVETVHREAGPGQFEINLRHDRPLRMADHTVLFKSAIREIMQRKGLIATFMAKPFSDAPGSGFHLHQSLWDIQGRSNVLAGPDGLSRSGLHFIGGQLEHLPGSMAFFAPTVNSYRRFRRAAFVPVDCSWGYENRTVALRVPAADPAGCRVENRVAGADANPYLVIASALLGGLLGIKHSRIPPKPTEGNAHASDANTPLPRSLAGALRALAEDAVLTSALGDDLVILLTTIKRAEQEAHEQQVPQEERQAYLRVS